MDLRAKRQPDKRTKPRGPRSRTKPSSSNCECLFASKMASGARWRARVLPGLLAAGFALLALGMICIHQQGRQQSLMEVRARRSSLHSKMHSFFALLKHPVRYATSVPPLLFSQVWPFLLPPWPAYYLPTAPAQGAAAGFGLGCRGERLCSMPRTALTPPLGCHCQLLKFCARP